MLRVCLFAAALIAVPALAVEPAAAPASAAPVSAAPASAAPATAAAPDAPRVGVFEAGPVPANASSFKQVHAWLKAEGLPAVSEDGRFVAVLAQRGGHGGSESWSDDLELLSVATGEVVASVRLAFRQDPGPKVAKAQALADARLALTRGAALLAGVRWSPLVPLKVVGETTRKSHSAWRSADDQLVVAIWRTLFVVDRAGTPKAQATDVGGLGSLFADRCAASGVDQGYLLNVGAAADLAAEDADGEDEGDEGGGADEMEEDASPPEPGCPCLHRPFVGAVWTDEARRVALVKVDYTGDDVCAEPDTRYQPVALPPGGTYEARDRAPWLVDLPARWADLKACVPATGPLSADCRAQVKAFHTRWSKRFPKAAAIGAAAKALGRK